MPTFPYPSSLAERTRWILERRGPRNELSPKQPYAFLSERERTARGEIADVATIFLTNRECPWKCVMCDLWRNTTVESVAPGEIPEQIEFALTRLPNASVLKLYNSGSFFDSAAIPRSDWKRIAQLCRSFEHVIVESHPLLIGPGVLEFASRLDASLEVAMGLETCHPAALEALNKRIKLADFERAAAFLNAHRIALRVFLLVHPPFIPASEQKTWAQKSIRRAVDLGSEVVSLIPTRAGNGALEALRALGEFQEPSMEEIEAAMEYGIDLGGPRIFGDIWEIERFAKCPRCARERARRIHQMNLSQTIPTPVTCSTCGSGTNTSRGELFR